LRATLWGTRGSIASAGKDTVRYGGDTACVEVRSDSGDLLILDAGSGIRALGSELTELSRIDIALSHLHMDHVQGLPFFGPMLDPDVEVHIWGPISTTRTLQERLSRYLSPPLFPVRVRDLQNVHFHDVPPSTIRIGSFSVTADLVTHPGTTLGYRVSEGDATITYLPDHEPALGNGQFPSAPEWTSGFAIVDGTDVLIHDAQYTDDEYAERVGWGHTSISQLASYVCMTRPGRLVTFHHDPSHNDGMLDDIHLELAERCDDVPVEAGTDRLSFKV